MGVVIEKPLVADIIATKKGLKFLGMIAAVILQFICLIMLMAILPNIARAESRIKDIVNVEGVRDNILVGYGLVVGLNGTGDKLNNSAFTEKSLQAFLERIGISVSDTQLKVKNVAAVTITAVLPPFARAGSRVDVSVSTIGDAKSLQGGTLVASPLMGADGEVYALAQGALTISGFEATGKSGSSISKGVPTTGIISGGAIIEREVAFNMNSMKEINLGLKNPDNETAHRVMEIINKTLGNIAEVRDPGTVIVKVKDEYKNNVAGLIAAFQPLTVTPDQVARVTIDESSGTIVMNENVRIDPVAVAQGNLIVNIREMSSISQPNPLSDGKTKKSAVSEVNVLATSARMTSLKTGASLQELIAGLNALGVSPRDLIGILQTIKLSGALQAEIAMR
jgi:flagellar P-ring protein FlgI